jgi:ABC-type uncharacterized transport system permease subunit
MQRAIQIPASLVIAVNGLVVVFVAASVSLRRRVVARVEGVRVAAPQAEVAR